MNTKPPAEFETVKKLSLNTKIIEKFLWAMGGSIITLLLAIVIGGVYTITPPNGPVDTAYKINRFTGKVWLIKTYAKPVAQGQLRVITAREAEVEKTKDLSEDDMQTLMTGNPALPAVARGRR
jgi:hypothetical protein